jgi:hypothetical protein
MRFGLRSGGSLTRGAVSLQLRAAMSAALLGTWNDYVLSSMRYVCHDKVGIVVSGDVCKTKHSDTRVWNVHRIPGSNRVR